MEPILQFLKNFSTILMRTSISETSCPGYNASLKENPCLLLKTNQNSSSIQLYSAVTIISAHIFSLIALSDTCRSMRNLPDESLSVFDSLAFYKNH